MQERDLTLLVLITASVLLIETLAFVIGDLVLVVILAAGVHMVLCRIEETRSRETEIVPSETEPRK